MPLLGVIGCMSAASPIDLPGLRRSCAHSSLHSLCLAGGMSDAEMQRLDAIDRQRRPLAAGARLFRMGEVMGSVFVTRGGAAKTVTVDKNGDEQIIGFHLPGELIGLDALADGRHRCQAVALTRASLCEIPFVKLGEVAGRIPGLQQQLLRAIGMSLSRNHDHKTMLVRRSGQRAHRAVSARPVRALPRDWWRCPALAPADEPHRYRQLSWPGVGNREPRLWPPAGRGLD